MATQQRERAEVVADFVGMDYKGAADFDYSAADQRVMPLNALTPFATKSWVVKARVVEKAPVRRWRNAKGTGLVTNITIIDENKTAMRATLFSDGVEKYYRMLQIGKVFYFGPSQKSGGNSVRGANKAFSSLASDYELALDETSVIQPVRGSDAAIAAIPQQTTANFLRLSELNNRQDKTTTDIRAVVVTVGAFTEVVSKTTGTALKRRVIQICDNSGPSGTQADLTLFEDAAKRVPQTLKPGEVMEAKGMRVDHWNGTAKLTAPREANIQWGIEDAKLTEWWNSQGKVSMMKGYVHNISQRQEEGTKMEIKGAFRLGLKEIEDQKMGLNEKPDYINVRCTVMGFAEKEDRAQYYDACPEMIDVQGEKRQCGKKIENFIAGSKAHCQKCDCTVEHVVQRYIAGVRIADHTGERWTTLFNETGEDFFGCPASALKATPERLDLLKKQLTGSQQIMTLRVKERITPDGNPKMEAQCVRVRPIRGAREWTIDCRNMLNDLERYHGGDASQVQIP